MSCVCVCVYRFNTMVGELQDLASGMQRTSRVFQAHQEAMEAQVMGTLQEYSGVINTFPGLVRLHEEAMEFYNSSKNKDSVSLLLTHAYIHVSVLHTCMCTYSCETAMQVSPSFSLSLSPFPALSLSEFCRRRRPRKFVRTAKPSTTFYWPSLTTSATTLWMISRQ